MQSVFAVARLMQFMTTWYGIAVLGFREMDPLMAWFIRQAGGWTIVLVLILLEVLAFGAYQRLWERLALPKRSLRTIQTFWIVAVLAVMAIDLAIITSNVLAWGD